MNVPLPENPRLAHTPDLYAAVAEFVALFALPALDPADIVHGWRNLEFAPPPGEDYAVLSVVRHLRQGENRESFHTAGPGLDEPGVLTLTTLVHCVVQVDFCGRDDAPRLRAQALETVAASLVAENFFKARGLGMLRAENVRELPLTGREKIHPIPLTGDRAELVRRYMLRLHISCWTGLEMDIPWFDNVLVERIENVGAHHPPKE